MHTLAAAAGAAGAAGAGIFTAGALVAGVLAAGAADPDPCVDDPQPTAIKETYML